MVVGLVGRREQEEDCVDRLMVEGVEIDPRRREPDGRGQPLHALVLHVRNGDPLAEAGVRGEAALGLGLPLTQQFIEAHGGTVELQSERGKGTTVILTVPRGTR